MNNFSYARARDDRQAIDMLERSPEAAYLGGGTNLVDYMKEGVLHPTALVDVRGLPHAKIEEHGGALRIGAMATNTAVAYHPIVQARYPVLAQAILAGASPQIRNMATVGGNLMQRTRCPYFRDTAFACNKREPGTGCSALEGYNRSHAVLGGSEACIATHASDMCVALVALEAAVLTTGPDGERRIPLNEFHRLPGDTPHLETVLKPGELITVVELPPLGFARRSVYVKVRDRASFEFALASAAVALELRGTTIGAARVALGGIGTKPWRSPAAELALTGRPATEPTFRAAAEAALQAAQPHRHNAFKVDLAKRTLMRALASASNLPTA
jgi:xanthine dehydrogenase YagS FAD-binding subunit